jgi:hypothetical protein
LGAYRRLAAVRYRQEPAVLGITELEAGSTAADYFFPPVAVAMNLSASGDGDRVTPGRFAGEAS